MGRFLVFLSPLAILLSACAGNVIAPVESKTVEPDVYVVSRGDTLHAIAWRFGVDYLRIAHLNRLANPDLIFPGQRLRIPQPARRPLAAAPPPPPVPAPPVTPVPPPAAPVAVAAVPHPQPAALPATVEERKADGMIWRWPTQGRVVRGFEPDVPGRKGIQIGGRLGQAVLAASRGEVVYSGSGLPGYGRLIILKHSNSLLSAYGFLGNILVKEGDVVEIGQPIAEMGASSESRPALHFEIRLNGEPINPLRYLPG